MVVNLWRLLMLACRKPPAFSRSSADCGSRSSCGRLGESIIMVDAPRPEHSQTPAPRDPAYQRLLSLLERASGPSRDLDLLIERLTTTSSIHSDHLDRWPEHAKHFTSSLDAALTLMPEGWQFGIGT